MTRFPRRVVRWSSDAALFGAALLALAGLAAERSEVFDFVNHFAPLWAAIGLLSGVLSLIPPPPTGRTLRAGAVALVLLGAGVRLGPELVAASRVREPAVGPVVRLVQFNAYKGNREPEAAARWLLRQQADILVLEEVPVGSPLREALAGRYPHVVGCLARARCSTLIFSRRRPLATGSLSGVDPENRRSLSAAWATFAGPAGRYSVVAVHLSRPWPWGVAYDEIGIVARFLDSMDRRTAIVAGDFNRAPWSQALSDVDRRLGLPRATRALATWPVRAGGLRLLPLLPIDHVYAGRDWAIRDVRRGPASLGSDHLPVVVTLGVDARARP
ncbi:MAG: endonuclease/exonuclease/phosphatase family protein [Rhizorhabdus sp.]